MKSFQFSFMLLFLFLTSCDGAFRVTLFTVEGNTISGLFETAQIIDGAPVGNVDIQINLAGIDGYNGLRYDLKTDSLGKLTDGLPVPPLKKKAAFKGFISWNKEGYKTDTLFFDHSSVDKRIAVINMQPLK